ncbi:MAG: outer membrane protein transport protein [Myxococcaceae bacterium]
MSVAIAGAIAGTSLPARADVYDTYGFGPRAAAMGGAMTAEANDYTAVFYNPALLVERKDVNFGFNFHFYRMVSQVQSKDLAKDLDCSSCTAPDSVGTSLGLLFPLGGKVKNHLAFGLGVYVPTAVLLRLNAPSSKTPYWYRYNGNPERLQLHLGAGIKIVDWFKIGLGVQVLADLIGDSSNVSVDLFSKNIKSGELNAYLGTRVAPIFSLHLSPLQRLRIGVTYRWEMQLKYQIPAKVDLEGIGTLAFVISGVAHYSPHTIQFGVAFDALENLTFSLDGEFQLWSLAPSPYVGINIDLSGPTLDALGLGSALDVSSSKQPPGLANTFGGRLGAEYRLSERFVARAGAFLRPTPVPKQDTQGTNLLDNTTIGASVGVGFNFPDPLEIFQHPIQIDLAGQAQFVLAREAKKATTDDQPGYTYSANVYGVSAAIRYDF